MRDQIASDYFDCEATWSNKAKSAITTQIAKIHIAYESRRLTAIFYLTVWSESSSPSSVSTLCEGLFFVIFHKFVCKYLYNKGVYIIYFYNYN